MRPMLFIRCDMRKNIQIRQQNLIFEIRNKRISKYILYAIYFHSPFIISVSFTFLFIHVHKLIYRKKSYSYSRRDNKNEINLILRSAAVCSDL